MSHTAHSNSIASRRGWLKACTALGMAATVGASQQSDRARISITLDLEMSRNFPTWETTHWDYEKGNLNDQAKEYSVAAARRVAAAGGHIHFFVVGRVLEQANIDWLKELRDSGHPLGNHTYDHVNVTATKLEDVQFRFARAPWLAAGQTPEAVIRQNIRLCSEAMQTRLGIAPNGFRTPGGFATGLKDHPQVRAELLSQGYQWVSSLYPPHLTEGSLTTSTTEKGSLTTSATGEGSLTTSATGKGSLTTAATGEGSLTTSTTGKGSLTTSATGKGSLTTSTTGRRQPPTKPTQAVIDDIVAKQAAAQPFKYPDGLIELPMSPISDIGAFRTGRWQVDWFVEVTRQAVQWCIDHQAAFDFLAHPSCLGVMDPEFKTIDMILESVRAAGSRAELVTLDQLCTVAGLSKPRATAD